MGLGQGMGLGGVAAALEAGRGEGRGWRGSWLVGEAGSCCCVLPTGKEAGMVGKGVGVGEQGGGPASLGFHTCPFPKWRATRMGWPYHPTRAHLHVQITGWG